MTYKQICNAYDKACRAFTQAKTAGDAEAMQRWGSEMTALLKQKQTHERR